jgi:outer membrane receptor protein involved in Fe transport
VNAVGDRLRFDQRGSATLLPAYTTVDARVRYRFEKFWSVELAATNLSTSATNRGGLRRAAARPICFRSGFDAF